jgi:hypothetical protein
MTRRECFGRRADESHLFVCPSCRADARIAAAWKDLSFPEGPAGADEGFVARVAAEVLRDRAARSGRRWLLAAAAAAVFAFFAGYAHERASGQAAAPTAEESYASLAAPGGLELVPSN